MSDNPQPSAESGNGEPRAPATPPARWQVGLRTIFLLIAAIAVWMTVLINGRRNASLEAAIARMRPLARELIVEDPSRIVVVKLEELWLDENRWEVYLPQGEYRLCLATRNVEPDGITRAVTSARLEKGRHRLALDLHPEAGGWRVAVTVDGAERLSVEEPKEWNPGRGSTGGSEGQTPSAAEKPVVLFRSRFSRPDGRGGASAPVGPAEGILLWIERAAGP